MNLRYVFLLSSSQEISNDLSSLHCPIFCSEWSTWSLQYQLQRTSPWRSPRFWLYCWLVLLPALLLATTVPYLLHYLLAVFTQPPPPPLIQAAAVAFGILTEILLLKWVSSSFCFFFFFIVKLPPYWHSWGAFQLALLCLGHLNFSSTQHSLARHSKRFLLQPVWKHIWFYYSTSLVETAWRTKCPVAFINPSRSLIHGLLLFSVTMFLFWTKHFMRSKILW